MVSMIFLLIKKLTFLIIFLKKFWQLWTADINDLNVAYHSANKSGSDFIYCTPIVLPETLNFRPFLLIRARGSIVIVKWLWLLTSPIDSGGAKECWLVGLVAMSESAVRAVPQGQSLRRGQRSITASEGNAIVWGNGQDTSVLVGGHTRRGVAYWTSKMEENCWNMEGNCKSG